MLKENCLAIVPSIINMVKIAIAHRLHISLRAVQNHIQHLKVKLGIDEVEQKDINSRIALCMTALQKKLLSF
ncbi:MAG: hypothetical protein V7L00_18295 [Nostoc sp.]|uniref:hypothetical protein n=1 Tax=Nostoc sp. TaxID=1180 RepID=UPI002FF9DBC9